MSFRCLCLHFASRRDRSCHVLRCAPRSNPHHRAFPAPLPPSAGSFRYPGVFLDALCFRRSSAVQNKWSWRSETKHQPKETALTRPLFSENEHFSSHWALPKISDRLAILEEQLFEAKRPFSGPPSLLTTNPNGPSQGRHHFTTKQNGPFQGHHFSRFGFLNKENGLPY